MASRRRITELDVPSVVRVTFALSLAISAVILVGLIALYLFGLVSGGLGGFEGFIASLGFEGFRFSVLVFVLAFVIGAGVSSAVMAALAALVALLYNALVPFVGGLELRSRGD